MSDGIDVVLTISQRLDQLKNRLAALEAEKLAIKEEMAACMAQLAGTAGRNLPPPPNAAMKSQVLWVLQKYEDRALSPLDISYELNRLKKRELTNVRLILTRLLRSGEIRRIGHGRYQIRKD